MDQLTRFVQEHLNDDTARLLLNRDKWPEIDIQLAVACIESRHKLRNKVQEWYANPELVFPVRLSAEQCSSTATGFYKAALASEIVPGARIADLTGGLGVDTWYFSRTASEVHYHEMQETLCRAAIHNFKTLKAGNITVNNIATSVDTIHDILIASRPDIVYMDPARRDESGNKVFLIEDCTPDVLTLSPHIFSHCRHMLLKLSPMADITMLCSRLGKECRQVHVVGYRGECKEILIWMDREWNDEYTVHAVELPHDYPACKQAEFSFKPSEEKGTKAATWTGAGFQPGYTYLFEPGKALMKSGCFNLIASRSGLSKLGTSTHYYITSDPIHAGRLKEYGRVFCIMEMNPLDKRSIKSAGVAYPKAEVTARNIPMDTETLRKKTGITSGDDAHIFGLKSDVLGNLLMITRKL